MNRQRPLAKWPVAEFGVKGQLTTWKKTNRLDSTAAASLDSLCKPRPVLRDFCRRESFASGSLLYIGVAATMALSLDNLAQPIARLLQQQPVAATTIV